MTQTPTTQHLSEEAINLLVNELPNYIKAALSFEDCLIAQRIKTQDK